MSGEEHEQELVKIVSNFSTKALSIFLHETIHFACVPRHVDQKNWCSLCEACWHKYAQMLSEKYPN